MRVIQIEVGHMRNFNYLLGCEATGLAACVDPAWEVDRVLEEAGRAGMKITHILITHTHPDHVEGLARAHRATGAAIMVSALEAGRARDCLLREGIGGAPLTELKDGDPIHVGATILRAMHTPGHTPGATCYLLPEAGDDAAAGATGIDRPGGVVTGDTLFIGRCGRTDFPGSDPEAMYRSLRRLAELPDRTVVYPGHNYADEPTSTIGRESRHNLHMSAPDLTEFLRRRMGSAYLARKGEVRT